MAAARHLLYLVLATLVAACGAGAPGDGATEASPPHAASDAEGPPSTVDLSALRVVPAPSRAHAPPASADGLADVRLVPEGPLGASRPATLHVPPSYVPGHAVPLVMLLHGYGGSGAVEEAYMNITPQSDAYGFLYVYPDGTKDPAGNRFWNATNACCNFFSAPVDDSAYLSGLIQQIEARYDVIPSEVFIIGHSNGAFMAYRMACDHAGLVSGVVSLAGAMWQDAASCAATAPVRVLEIHGTDDPLVPFTGGYLWASAFPSAHDSIMDWVTRNGCTPTPDTSAQNLDLDATLPGAETTVTRYASCSSGMDAQLWAIQGGDHVPELTDEFAFDVISHLLGTPKDPL